MRVRQECNCPLTGIPEGGNPLDTQRRIAAQGEPEAYG